PCRKRCYLRRVPP
ncbi:nusA N-terminal domain protein, partial [Chlamydia psittaci 08DC60]